MWSPKPHARPAAGWICSELAAIVQDVGGASPAPPVEQATAAVAPLPVPASPAQRVSTAPAAELRAPEIAERSSGPRRTPQKLNPPLTRANLGVSIRGSSAVRLTAQKRTTGLREATQQLDDVAFEESV